LKCQTPVRTFECILETFTRVTCRNSHVSRDRQVEDCIRSAIWNTGTCVSPPLWLECESLMTLVLGCIHYMYAFLIHYVRHVGRPAGCIRTRWEGEGLKCSPVSHIPNRSVFGCIGSGGAGKFSSNLNCHRLHFQMKMHQKTFRGRNALEELNALTQNP
jgi:hypothetical protein